MAGAAANPLVRFRTLIQRHWPRLLAAVIGGVLGGWAGAEIKYLSTLGGLGGSLGSYFLSIGVAALTGLLGVAGLLGAVFARGRGLASTAFVAAGSLAGLTLAAYAVAPGYQPPLYAAAEVRLELDTNPVVAWQGRGECVTIENGARIDRVHINPIGELSGQDVWVSLSLENGAGRPTLSFGQANDTEVQQPFAYRQYATRPSAVQRLSIEGDGLAGEVDFEGLPLVEGPPLDVPGQPRELKGRVTWRCGSSFGREPPPPEPIGALEGTVRLEGAVSAEISLSGVCYDPDVGFIVWTGALTLADGRPALVMIQAALDGLSISIYPDGSKQDQIGGLISTQLPRGGDDVPEGARWAVSGSIHTAAGPLQVEAEWTCRA